MGDSIQDCLDREIAQNWRFDTPLDRLIFLTFKHSGWHPTVPRTEQPQHIANVADALPGWVSIPPWLSVTDLFRCLGFGSLQEMYDFNRPIQHIPQVNPTNADLVSSLGDDPPQNEFSTDAEISDSEGNPCDDLVEGPDGQDIFTLPPCLLGSEADDEENEPDPILLRLAQEYDDWYDGYDPPDEIIESEEYSGNGDPSQPSWVEIMLFYRGLNESTRRSLDLAGGGSLGSLTPWDAWNLIREMATGVVHDHSPPENSMEESVIHSLSDLQLVESDELLQENGTDVLATESHQEVNTSVFEPP